MYGAPSDPTVARRPQYAEASNSCARETDISLSFRLMFGGLLKMCLLWRPTVALSGGPEPKA